MNDEYLSSISTVQDIHDGRAKNCHHAKRSLITTLQSLNTRGRLTHNDPHNHINGHEGRLVSCPRITHGR